MAACEQVKPDEKRRKRERLVFVCLFSNPASNVIARDFLMGFAGEKPLLCLASYSQGMRRGDGLSL